MLQIVQFHVLFEPGDYENMSVYDGSLYKIYKTNTACDCLSSI
jgi:hypothetical protein